jgi:hypothetical protein
MVGDEYCHTDHMAKSWTSPTSGGRPGGIVQLNSFCCNAHHHVLFCCRFIGDESAFDNGTKYPEKRCYCAKTQMIATSEISACSEECMPSGVRGISKCRFGAPAFVSFPHFYEADPSYLLNIKGLNPDQDLHEFYVAVEPVSYVAYLPFSIWSRLRADMSHWWVALPNLSCVCYYLKDWDCENRRYSSLH